MTTVVAYYYDLENRTSIHKDEIHNKNHSLSCHLEEISKMKTENTMFNKYSDLYYKVYSLLKEINSIININEILKKLFFDDKNQTNSLFEMYLVINYLDQEYHLELFTFIITSLLNKEQLRNLISYANTKDYCLNSFSIALEEYYTDTIIKLEIEKINLFLGLK
jgi:hypothetical protein